VITQSGGLIQNERAMFCLRRRKPSTEQKNWATVKRLRWKGSDTPQAATRISGGNHKRAYNRFGDIHLLYETLTEENRLLLDRLLPTYRLKGRDLGRERTWCVNVLQLRCEPERHRYSDGEMESVVKAWYEAGEPVG